MDLLTFKKRMAEAMFAKLVKSTDPRDFSGMVKEITPEGKNLVDHKPHLLSHPPAHQPQVDHYRSAISGSAPLMHSLPHNLHGVTAKTVFKLPQADNSKLPGGDKIMVKPYHEHLDKRVSFWMNKPIQGWAEMTNQSLWHAAGMGHMHQRVHVSEHNMGPGFENEPAIVVHMTPDTEYASNMKPEDFDPEMMEELPKIAAMDFLTGNLDRHGKNLLFTPRGAKDRYGIPRTSRFVAIDHGRSFQYHASGKGVPSHVEDPIFGPTSIPEETRNSILKEMKEWDGLHHYLGRHGIRAVDRYAPLHGLPITATSQGAVPAIVKWWPKVRNAVVGAFRHNLGSIKDEATRNYIDQHFHDRVGLLDQIAARPDLYMEASRQHLRVPIRPAPEGD